MIPLLIVLALQTASVKIGPLRLTFSLPPEPNTVVQIAPDTLRIGGAVDFRVKSHTSGYLEIRFAQGVPNLNLCTADPEHDWSAVSRASWAVTNCFPNWTTQAYERWSIRDGIFSLFQ